MYMLDKPVETETYQTDSHILRRTKCNELSVSEYQSKTSDYHSIDCRLHDIDFDSIKTRNKTLKLENGDTVKSKMISFRGRDGVHHELVLYAPHHRK